ncbi:hypothetical protein CPC08DRAFT_704095 [Agrocybe pediades]|nr:hypothetical protein CPC08DRAFT_704095 [Agrocybe pediades]
MLGPGTTPNTDAIPLSPSNCWQGRAPTLTTPYYPLYYSPQIPWVPISSPYSVGFPLPSKPPIRLHPSLRVNKMNYLNPDLVWDIVHYPDHARLIDRQRFKHYLKPAFEATAFEPDITKVWIVSDHPVLSHWIDKCWGHISVKAGEGKKLTVFDVLYGVYDYMRRKLTPADMQHARQVPGNDKKIRAAGYTRIKESYELDAVGEKIGCVRADVVGHHRRFGGMRVVQIPNSAQWVLVLSLLPGPTPRLP